MSIYEIEIPTATGEFTTLEAYKGQLLLIVNTANGCGLAPQFEGLEQLYQEFKNQGFSVLGFPCNQFAGQEPLTAEQAITHCQLTYHTTFPMFGKVKVNGPETHPLFAILKKETAGLFGEKVKWNFTKFLVAQDGTILKRFAPTTTPEQIHDEIASLLA